MTNPGPEFKMDSATRRYWACDSACRRITTECLETNIVEDMIEALEHIAWNIEGIERTETKHIMFGQTRDAVATSRAVLARLKFEEEEDSE